MLTFATQYVNLKNITTGRNVRLPSLMKVEELAADIHDNGLMTPLTVFQKGQEFLTIAGHRRGSALHKIYNEEPEHFAKLFPKGIPVSVASGITEAEAEAMKVDHGNEVGLQDPMELQLCANILFQQGLTEKAVVIRLAALMDRIQPMKADAAKKYRQMLSDAELWKEKGNLTEYRAKLAEAYTFLLNYRRGKIQNLSAAFDCPDVVMAALYFKSTGERPPKESGFAVPEKEVIPNGITYEHVKKLKAAFAKDLAVIENGTSKYNKRVPGPEFLAKWNEIIADLKKKADDAEGKVPRDKAMSAGDMESELKSSKWNSKGFQILTRHHRNEKDVDMAQLKGYDQIAYTAELLSSRAPKEWADCVKLAEAIEAEMIAATQNVVPEAPKVVKKATGGKQK
jgi:hypothetical protein